MVLNKISYVLHLFGQSERGCESQDRDIPVLIKKTEVREKNCSVSPCDHQSKEVAFNKTINKSGAHLLCSLYGMLKKDLHYAHLFQTYRICTVLRSRHLRWNSPQTRQFNVIRQGTVERAGVGEHALISSCTLETNS